MRIFPKCLLWGIMLASYCCLHSQPAGLPPVQQKAILVQRVAQLQHYQARPLDDAFSRQIFDHILEDIDPAYIFLSPAEVATLQKYATLLDDELQGAAWAFLPALQKSLTHSAGQAKAWVQTLLQKPITTAPRSAFQLPASRSMLQGLSTEKDWQIRWQNYLAWQVMETLTDSWEATKTNENDTTPPPAADSPWWKKEEPLARAAVLDDLLNQLNAFTADASALQTKLETTYLDILSSSFDPHTAYFDANAKADFTSALSTENLIFGFQLAATESGELMIDKLVPGSPAWFAGSIFAKDIIKSIQLPNKEAVALKGMGRTEVHQLLNTIQKEEVEFTLQGQDGKERKVKLRKGEVENEENLVKGYLLEGTKKIGYISLPSFYTEWDDNESSSCASDLAKEIVKLKREKIEGLIFDLRYNGGGSLQEAIEIAGIFIEAGPMAIIKQKGGKRQTLKDPSRGSIYDGPLLVMINGQSASASELVAGTLQDYNRALIVGSPSFGKATMQTIIPLDTTKNQMRSASQGGSVQDFLKITTGALYRINGSSNQFFGVQPHVALPDAFELSEYAERNLPSALPPDTVVHTVPFTPLAWPWGARLSVLQQLPTRIPYLHDMQAWIERQKQNKAAQEQIPLQWPAFVQWYYKDPMPTSGQATYQNTSAPYKVANAAFNAQILALENAYRQQQDNDRIETISNDFYIHAAYQCFIQTNQ